MVIAAESAYFYLPLLPLLGAVPDMGTTWDFSDEMQLCDRGKPRPR